MNIKYKSGTMIVNPLAIVDVESKKKGNLGIIIDVKQAEYRETFWSSRTCLCYSGYWFLTKVHFCVSCETFDAYKEVEEFV